MLDTFAFASQAISHALGVSAIVEAPMGRETVNVVLGAGFERVQSGDLRVASRRLEVTVTVADFGTASTATEDWVPGTVEFVEGPLAPRRFAIVTPKPDIEGVSLTLVLKGED